MEKHCTLLDRMAQEMVDKMSPEQCAEAKKIWDLVTADGMTPENMALYNNFCAKTYGIPAIQMGAGKTRVIAGAKLASDSYPVKRGVPKATQFILFMFSCERRDDILADLNAWYPNWCEKFGAKGAKFLCWWRVGCCIGGAVLDVMGRLGEFIGKVAPK